MSKDCKENKIRLNRNGTDQNQRLLKALSPESVKLHDLTLENWMAFAYEFGKNVKYFEGTENRLDGSWEDFFLEKDSIKTSLVKCSKNNDLTPHLTLFVCFLKLISLSQKRLNKLSKKHLDFYYKKILSLSNKAATPDQVHVIFELAKNATQVKVPKGTELNAGKDVNGNNLVYETQDELIVNETSVAELRNCYHFKNKGIVYSSVANSYDGKGEAFPENEESWWPFGHPYPADNFSELSYADVGFAIASPILKLEKGTRKIIFTITLAENVKTTMNGTEVKSALKVYLSGEKKWIEAELESLGNEQCSVLKKEMVVIATLDANAASIVEYNQDKLEENFDSTYPLARFLFNSGENDKKGMGYKMFQNLSGNTIKSIKINVEVSEIIDAEIENDQGKADAKKPFYPFGTIPSPGSSLLINASEACNKNWTKIKAEINWKDAPEDFKKHYLAYRKNYLTNLSKKGYSLQTIKYGDNLDGGILINDESDFETKVEAVSKNGSIIKGNSNNSVLFVEQAGGGYTGSFEISRAESVVIENKPWGNNVSLSQLFKNFKKYSDFAAKDNVKAKIEKLWKKHKQELKTNTQAQDGYLKLTLQDTFYHDLFPRIYAVALSKNDNQALIPNEPYTPLTESLKVSYDAVCSLNFPTSKNESQLENSYLKAEIELFHEHPFGQSEQHPYLKSQHNYIVENDGLNCSLLPSFDNGQLYIALKGGQELDSVTLLVQVLEGSENPEPAKEDEFGADEKLQWYILSNDEWKPLNKDYVSNNTTDNFLNSGIVKFTIPREATKNNNLITGDYYWLKVENPKAYDSVSRMIDVHAQAVTAKFADNSNDLSHLENGLEAETISKLVERIATIKKVTQPYNSYDGVPKESDTKFYQRVSERLRHKQRAITIWDYEHLILEEYPKIYKANCIKYSGTDCELSPGDVTVVVIPNIIKKNVYNKYQPRVSKSKLNEIATFINKLNTLHVTAKLENPVYEEVKVKLDVKFYDGYDENYYTKQLQKDIAMFLAPWAFEKTADINFGVTLHESRLIHYIEKLKYVDYIKNFKLYQGNGKRNEKGKQKLIPVKKAAPSCSKVILTSVKYDEHEVTSITGSECGKITE